MASFITLFKWKSLFTFLTVATGVIFGVDERDGLDDIFSGFFIEPLVPERETEFIRIFIFFIFEALLKPILKTDPVLFC